VFGVDRNGKDRRSAGSGKVWLRLPRRFELSEEVCGHQPGILERNSNSGAVYIRLMSGATVTNNQSSGTVIRRVASIGARTYSC
jgi:hypothetical protein